MSNPCPKEPLFSAYLDSELTDTQADELRKHLADCPGCRRVLESLGHADTLIRDLPPLSPSAAFDRTFWEKIETLERESRYRLWARHIFTGWRPIWAGAIMAMVVAVLVYYGGNDPLSPEDVFIAEHMELLEDYDVIGQLEMLEQLDATEMMKDLS